MRSQPSSQSYLVRLQGLLRPVRTENTSAHSDLETGSALEGAENGSAHDQTISERSLSLSQSTSQL